MVTDYQQFLMRFASISFCLLAIGDLFVSSNLVSLQVGPPGIKARSFGDSNLRNLIHTRPLIFSLCPKAFVGSLSTSPPRHSQFLVNMIFGQKNLATIFPFCWVQFHQTCFFFAIKDWMLLLIRWRKKLLPPLHLANKCERPLDKLNWRDPLIPVGWILVITNLKFTDNSPVKIRGRRTYLRASFLLVSRFLKCHLNSSGYSLRHQKVFQFSLNYCQNHTYSEKSNSELISKIDVFISSPN